MILLCNTCSYFYSTNENHIDAKYSNPSTVFGATISCDGRIGPIMCNHPECFSSKLEINNWGVEEYITTRIKGQAQLNYGNTCKFYKKHMNVFEEIFNKIKGIICN